VGGRAHRASVAKRGRGGRAHGSQCGNRRGASGVRAVNRRRGWRLRPRAACRGFVPALSLAAGGVTRRVPCGARLAQSGGGGCHASKMPTPRRHGPSRPVTAHAGRGLTAAPTDAPARARGGGGSWHAARRAPPSTKPKGASPHPRAVTFAGARPRLVGAPNEPPRTLTLHLGGATVRHPLAGVGPPPSARTRRPLRLSQGPHRCTPPAGVTSQQRSGDPPRRSSWYELAPVAWSPNPVGILGVCLATPPPPPRSPVWAPARGSAAIETRGGRRIAPSRFPRVPREDTTKQGLGWRPGGG